MKWGGKRGKSFHHGETTPRRFPGLGNSVKRPLSPIFVSSSIPCAEATTSSPFPRALLPRFRAFFPRGARSSSHGSSSHTRAAPDLAAMDPPLADSRRRGGGRGGKPRSGKQLGLKRPAAPAPSSRPGSPSPLLSTPLPATSASDA